VPIDGRWTIFAVGCMGGVLTEFASIWVLRKEDPRVWPAYLKRARYYVLSAIMVVLGGALAVAYDIPHMNVFLALNIGGSAPLIIQRLGQTVAPPPAAQVPPGARID
jgi:hypothetical protein